MVLNEVSHKQNSRVCRHEKKHLPILEKPGYKLVNKGCARERFMREVLIDICGPIKLVNRLFEIGICMDVDKREKGFFH